MVSHTFMCQIFGKIAFSKDYDKMGEKVAILSEIWHIKMCESIQISTPNAPPQASAGVAPAFLRHLPGESAKTTPGIAPGLAGLAQGATL